MKRQAEPVVIAAYDPEWPRLFEVEGAVLVEALGRAAIWVEHIGSTAVPGLAAKPIIDVLVALSESPIPGPVRDRLVGLGYRHRGENGIPGRDYFDRPGIHIHAFALGHPDLARHLAFRDYLRAHPDAAAAYERLKRDLAQRYREERATYTERKTAFIREIERLALGSSI